MNGTLLHILIEQLHVNPMQPRKHFNEEELEELASSIKAVGMIQPPLVKVIEGTDQYEIIAGERRVRACQRAGLNIIPVILMPMHASLSAEVALIENIQRVDLNPIEIAEAIRRLMIEFKLNQEEVAEKVGKKRSTIANYLRLLSLPACIQESLSKSCISMGHAKAILSVTTPEKQMHLFEAIAANHLSVRSAENLAKKMSDGCAPCKPSERPKSDQIQDLVERMQQCLGTKVNMIEGKNNCGQIRIDYYGLDDLERLLSLFL
jgi:ParB family transcriptional regulator, chromosome partitioning protein